MPIQIPTPFNVIVYTKTEIDSRLEPKANKVSDAIDDNIAGLISDDGDLKDTGYSIEDLLVSNIDGGTF